MSAEILKTRLAHSRMAYKHAVLALPTLAALQSGPITQHGMTFSSDSHVESQVIELGWAFFCRYEACLEKWLKDQGVKLSESDSKLSIVIS